MRLNNYFIEMVGKHSVAAELFKRDVICSLTLGNSPSVDMFAITQDDRSYSLQIKATFDATTSWLIKTSKEDTGLNTKHIYIFVDLQRNSSHPDFYVIPGPLVNKIISKRMYCGKYWYYLDKCKCHKYKNDWTVFATAPKHLNT